MGNYNKAISNIKEEIKRISDGGIGVIRVSVQVAASLIDNENFNKVDQDQGEMKGPEPYKIGNLEDVIFMVDPLMEWGNLNIMDSEGKETLGNFSKEDIGFLIQS